MNNCEPNGRCQYADNDGKSLPLTARRTNSSEARRRKRAGGKTAINGVIIGDGDLKVNIGDLDELINGSGDDARQNSGYRFDFGIRHKDIHKGKENPDQYVRKQF